MTDTKMLQEHLNTALDNLLAVIVLTGGDLGDATPDRALDTALATDPSVRNARLAFQEALVGLDSLDAGNERHQTALTVEGAVNALVVAAVDSVYRLGVKVGRGLSG